MRVVGSAEMREIENRCFKEFNFCSSLIIENIGVQGSSFIEKTLIENNHADEIVFLIGKGNNGADGLAIARHVANQGHSVRAFILFPKVEHTKEFSTQKKLASCFGVKFTEVSQADQLESYFLQIGSQSIVVDAILGIGFRSPLSHFLFEIINTANQFSKEMVSLDLPSGLCADSGDISSTSIKADFTLSVALYKKGQFLGEGPKICGKVSLLDVGLPQSLLRGGHCALLTPLGVAGIYAPRDPYGDKRNFGHVLVIGGSYGMTGAICMCAEAAMRAGAGLVSAYTWSDSYEEMLSRLHPTIMSGKIPENDHKREDFIQGLDHYQSIVIGPGLGKGPYARDLVLEVLGHYSGPVVIDADAINILDFPTDFSLFSSRKGACVLTPHFGEMARLMKMEKNDFKRETMTLLSNLVEKSHTSIVLKGSTTYLGFPTGEVFINHFPNSSLATAGSGDILAGIMGGVLAPLRSEVDDESAAIFHEDTKYYSAICLSVMLHSLAGKHASVKFGDRATLATSLIDHLQDAFSELERIAKDHQYLA